MYIDQLLPCNLKMQDDLEQSVKEKNVINECIAKEIVSDLNNSSTHLNETNKIAGNTEGHLNVSMQNAECRNKSCHFVVTVKPSSKENARF